MHGGFEADCAPSGVGSAWRAFAQLKFKEKGLAVDLNLKLLKDKKVVSEKWTYLWQP